MKKIVSRYKSFEKLYKVVPQKIRVKFAERVAIMLQDDRAKILNTHKLEGKFKDFYSINITGDWRALYKSQKTPDNVEYRFYYIGTHSQLYK